MGKNLREKHSGISNENEVEGGGGCAWGLLHIIKYHHWRHVKKRLSHRTRYLPGNHILTQIFVFIFGFHSILFNKSVFQAKTQVILKFLES